MDLKIQKELLLSATFRLQAKLSKDGDIALAVCFLVGAIGDDQIGGMCHIMTGLLKDLMELAEFISRLKQYNPKNSTVSNFQSSHAWLT